MAIISNIIDLRRFEKLYHQFGSKLHDRILSDKEKCLWNGVDYPSSYLAKRWCAKILVRKLLDREKICILNNNQLTIKNDIAGKPYVVMNETTTLTEMERKNIERSIFLSISDEHPYAMITVNFTTL